MKIFIIRWQVLVPLLWRLRREFLPISTKAVADTGGAGWDTHPPRSIRMRPLHSSAVSLARARAPGYPLHMPQPCSVAGAKHWHGGLIGCAREQALAASLRLDRKQADALYLLGPPPHHLSSRRPAFAALFSVKTSQPHFLPVFLHLLVCGLIDAGGDDCFVCVPLRQVCWRMSRGIK